MHWTMRRILTLIGAFSAIAVVSTLFWVSAAYEGFSVNTLNVSSEKLGQFLVKQRIREFYFGEMSVITDEWSRQSTLVDGARTNDAAKALIGANQTFNTKEVIEKIVDLKAVTVFDKDFKMLAQADKGDKISVSKYTDLIDTLKKREKREQRQAVYYLWTSDEGVPLHSMIVPIGGFRVAGFVEYVSAPVAKLHGIEAALGGDLKISDSAQNVLFDSNPVSETDPEAGDATPAAEATAEETNPEEAKGEEATSDDPTVAEDKVTPVLETVNFDVMTDMNTEWITLSLTRDIGEFKKDLEEVRNQSLEIIAAALIGSFIIGWLLLRLAVFRRLRQFATSMESLGQGETGIQIPPTGPDEFRIMADALEELREAVRQAFRRQRIIENNPACIAVADVDGSISYANLAAKQYLGIAADASFEELSSDLFEQGSGFLDKLADFDALPFKSTVTHNNEVVDLDVQPILSSHGNHTNTALTWTIVTEREAEKKLADETMENVTRISVAVTEQAQLLQSLSESLTTQSEQTVEHSRSASGISHKNSSNVNVVADTTTTLNDNFQNMSSKADDARSTADDALEAAKTGTVAISKLEDSSAKIGEVIALITDIASQTRLLALNATIESARAGEAGKGFAVVADEVGRLAGQTTNAAEDISVMIQGVQGEVISATDAIGKIDQIITRIHDIQAEVTDSVADQQVATSAIADNIRNIEDGSSNIDGIIQTVGNEAEKTGEISVELRSASQKLTQESINLQENIDEFRRRSAVSTTS
jgi:methyl-accepting chemotaxis protein